MQYVSRPHHYIGNRRQENNGLGRIGVSGQISRVRNLTGMNFGNPEPVRREEDVPHQAQPLRLLQFPDAEVVARRLHPREVGLDPYRLERRHDQQRRRLQVHLVSQQLVERPVQLGVLSLEIPAEVLLEVGIGGPARRRLLEGERLLSRAAAKRTTGVSTSSEKVPTDWPAIMMLL